MFTYVANNPLVVISLVNKTTFITIGPLYSIHVHLLYLEIRSHGVAYYQFATDEEKRQEQLAALNKLRDQVSTYSSL